MSDLPGRFDRMFARLALPPGPALVGVSGGPDSVALLHLLARSALARPLALTVAHVDHGIHPESALVSEQVRTMAAGLGLPFRSTRLKLGAGTSETRAREARYRWLLGEAAGAQAVLMTAHNRDDQVETVLMRVLRGTGVAGLAGMALETSARAAGPGGPVRLIRPLLGFGREEIREWVAALGLPVWTDPSNLDPAHERGWIRTCLLPLAEARDPLVRRHLLRTAEAARLDRAAWQSLLTVLPLDAMTVSDGISVASGPLRGYDFPLACGLVQAAGRRVGLSLGPRRAGRIVALVRRGRVGARLELGAGWLAEVNRGRLALVRPVEPAAEALEVAGAAGEGRLGAWTIRWRTEPPARARRDGWTAWVIPGRYEVDGWRPGDRIHPLGGRGSRLAVRCMQDAGVPRHQRAGWPVVRSAGEVIWVPGVCRSDLALPSEAVEAMRIDVEHP